MISKPQPAVLLVLALLATLLASPSQAQPVCVTFEPPDFVIGDVFGRPVGQSSGDLAFSSNGIDGYVFNFLTSLGPAFNVAYITNAPVAFSPGQSIRTNNINLLFDFTNLAFTAKKVTFYYLDLGGHEKPGAQSRRDLRRRAQLGSSRDQRRERLGLQRARAGWQAGRRRDHGSEREGGADRRAGALDRQRLRAVT